MNPFTLLRPQRPRTRPFLMSTALGLTLVAHAGARELPGVREALETQIAQHQIAGAVTLVVSEDRVLHHETTGFADLAANRRMSENTLFWIASMTKPVTAAAVLMLQDEGRLKVTDPVAKYIPEFAALRTPSGNPADLTLLQVLTHVSGLGEASGPAAQEARTLADLVPLWLAAPMQFEPGTRWSYCQSGINTASRIVEVVSGQPFHVFLEQRLFRPLGMRDTTFYPTERQRRRLATAYARNADGTALDPVPPRHDFGRPDRPPLGNGGLYSTGRDYARFCQMLLSDGTFRGRRYLSHEALRWMYLTQTGDLPTGFFQTEAFGRRGAHYGWGLGTCVLRKPHDGVAAMLSPGTFGHGGAWGTQAWIDPARGVAYILMVQRSNFPNSDASEVRRLFQKAAASALDHRQARGQ